MSPPSSASNTGIPWFSIPVTSEHYDDTDTSILTKITSPLSPVQKIQGKTHKSSVSGHLSVATILSNAFLLPGFPRSSYAIIQSGQLGLTFSQIDVISKRLALIISSLVLLPGVEYQVGSNSDGDSVVMIVLNEEDYVDEQLVVLIFTILRLGATYIIVHKSDLSSETKYWSQLMTLIEPILVITLGDPQDMPTAIKNDLNLVSRDHFEDFQEEEEPDFSFNDGVDSNSASLTDTTSPLVASSLLVKKIQSSCILKPNVLRPGAVSSKILWDLAMELKINSEKERDLQILNFRSDLQLGQRTAFIFPCVAPFHTGYGHQWCRLGHKAIRNRISWERMEFPMKPMEKVCLTFPLQDPRSLVQIFNSFIHGKALVLGDSGELHNGGFFLRKFRTESFRNVMRIELTPERLQELLDTAKQTGMEAQLGKIKTWMVSSSSGLQPSLAKRFFNVMKGISDIQLIVTYGKAECLWCATWRLFRNIPDVSRNTVQDKDGVSRLVVGVPLSNTTVYVVDERKNTLCSQGQRGEIWIAGCMTPCNGYSGGPVLGRSTNQIFQTGDIGKIILDRLGNLQLVVESDTEYPILLRGKLLDLEDISKKIKEEQRFVRDAYAFVCRRGRDAPDVIVAVVCNDVNRLDQIREMIEEVEPQISSCFPVNTIPKMSDGAVDLKQLRAAYFKYLGKCSSRKWNTLIPKKTNQNVPSPDEDLEENIKIICKAVAFSLGISLSQVIDGFERSFWEIGGSSLRAIMTVKSCLCQGKRLSIEDFVVANLISELGFRLVLAEKEDMTWLQDVTLIRQSFIYSRMTKSDHKDILEILMGNLKKLPESEPKEMEKYAQGLLETFDNSLGVVALTAETREIIGICLNFRGGIKFHFIPSKLEEGLELFTSILGSVKHMTHGIDNKNIAKSYIISVKTGPNHQILSPPQSMILIRDMIKESMSNSENVGCKGFLLCTMDPIVQEVCCSLLGFEMLTEVQLNMFKNKKLQKPFIHLDDHQMMGVYFRRIHETNN